MKTKYVRIYSDNFDGALLTFQAYEALRLTMSSGDFYSHRVIWFDELQNNNEPIFTLEDILAEENVS